MNSEDIFKLIAAIGVFGGIAMFLYVAFSWADDRAAARQSLKALDDYDNDIASRLRKIKSQDRKALTDQIVELGKRLTSAEREKAVRAKLTLAGRPTKDDVDRYMAERLIFALIAGAWVLLILFTPILTGNIKWIALAAGGLGFYRFPDIKVNRLKEERQKRVLRALPDTLDILSISVEAGLGFEQAVGQVVENIKGPLSEEFYRMLMETRAGSSRAEAMRGMDERCGVPELKSFILAIVQADQFGVSIAGILRNQADEMRVKRRQHAEEKAQKLPVKMLLPMVCCIFPSLLAVILGPAAIGIYRNF